MKSLSLSLLLFFYGACCFGQKQGKELIDSLLTEVPNAPNDSLKVRLYKQVADAYFFIDTEMALKYTRIGLTHAKRVGWKRAVSAFTTMIGRAYSDKGNIDSCLKYYNYALSMQKEANDNRNIATTLTNMGTAEQNIRSDFPKATQYYFQALKYAEKDNSPYMIASAYDNLSVVYMAQNNIQKSLDYALRALEICKKQDGQDPNFMNEWAISLINLATAYSSLKDVSKATMYFEKSIRIYNKIGSQEGLAMAYFGLASLPNQDFPHRIEYGLKAKGLWDQVNPMHLSAVANLGNLGITYFDIARYDTLHGVKRAAIILAPKNELLDKAESYLTTAIRLSDKKGESSNKSFYTGVLAELYAFKGDYKNAYLNFRAHQSVQDSLFSQENKNAIAGLEGKREIELRDKQIELNKLAFQSQKKLRIGLLIGLGLVTAIGALLYWQSQTRKRTNITLLHLNSELDEANKIKARFFAILSHDLRSPVSNLINFLHLQKEAPELMSGEIAEGHQKRITESAEALLENMESMLLWSKGQMENFRPQTRSIEVSELFGYIQRFFAGTSNVTISFSNPEDLTVVTDEDYLKTIMQNLTSNAVKATKKTNDAKILWEAKLENAQIILTISDNGPGASAEQLNALYTDDTVIGIKTGLGLHLIRDLAKAIACRISVKSNPDEGMKFQLVFAVV